MPSTLEKKLLTVPEAVDLFPAPVSVATVYRWAREGRFRTQKLGSKIFIFPDSVAEFIDRGLENVGDSD